MNSIIPLGQKNTLAEYMILSGADNRPPMLDKDLYDFWKSIIKLYMQNREHRRMILESVEHDPLIWPTIEENRVTRTKKYVKLSATEKIQADYDMKATNIILQGTSLTKKERECKLYDAFDKFTHIKFLNSLPPEWSKFVTHVNLVKDLHTTNFDQLHAYLEQHELHANEVRDDPIACLNKAMAFLTAVVSLRFPSTNNQLKTSSNPRNQATIQDGRVTVQGLINATIVKNKAMLAEAQEAGQILDEEQLAFLADPGIPDGQVVQTIIPNNVAFQTGDLNTYNSDCDDISNAKAVLMANISNYGSDVISKVSHSETYLNDDMENQSVHALLDFEQSPVMDFTDNKITSYSNIISYSQYLILGNTLSHNKNCRLNKLSGIICPNLPLNLLTVKMEAPKELPKVSLVNESLKKLKFHLANFDKVVKIRTTPDARTEDVLPTVMNSMSLIGEFVNMERKRNESCDKCFNLDAEILKTQNTHNDLLKSYSQLEKHCISLELTIQLNQEIFQKDESCDNQNAVEFPEYFENNDLKAQIQDEDTNQEKLYLLHMDLCGPMRVASINGKRTEFVNQTLRDFYENVGISHQTSVARTPQQNGFVERRNRTLVEAFRKMLIFSKAPLFLWAEAINTACYTQNRSFIRLRYNKTPYELMQDKKPDLSFFHVFGSLCYPTNDNEDLGKLDSKADIRILVGYVPAKKALIVLGMFKLDLEPLASSAKKVAVTPKNNVKKVRFAEPLTSSSNIKQVESSKTSDSNTHVLSPTGLKCSTSNCGSKSTGNKRNDRISQIPSRNMKNKVEAQPRKVNKKNHVVEPIHDVDVKYLLVNANSKLICATCKKSMFDGIHDMCLLDFVKNVNSRAKSVKENIKIKYWKTLWRHVFIEVGLKWKPKVRLYNIVGSSKKAKIVESKNANHSEPNHTWGSNATDIPSSSSLVMTGFPDCSLYFGLRMFKTYDREPLSAHELYKDGLARGIPRLKFQKDHLCSTCALGKSKKSTHQPKAEDTNQEKLYLLHMDLCGPMRVASINGKTYILVIVDDYSRFTWVRFLRTKDEAPEAIIKCIINIQVRLNATVCNVRTDNGTKFVNQKLSELYENVGISHQTSVAHTPQQNGVVERRN
ncbi:ribonuclease H-like domain-containing protein [Tanacetum coccineum]